MYDRKCTKIPYRVALARRALNVRGREGIVKMPTAVFFSARFLAMNGEGEVLLVKGMRHGGGQRSGIGLRALEGRVPVGK